MGVLWANMVHLKVAVMLSTSPANQDVEVF